jgi:hypothetical protein
MPLKLFGKTAFTKLSHELCVEHKRKRSLVMPKPTEDYARAHPVSGEQAIEWMRGVLTSLAESVPTACISRNISLAGLSLQLLFDDGELAKNYVDMMSACELDAPCQHRIFILTADQSAAIGLPNLDRSCCSPEQFQSLVKSAGMRAAYPFQDGVWKFYDVERKIGVQLTQSRQTLPLWDATAPLRQHLHWLLDEKDQRLAHAATLGLDGKGLVMFGAGGAGKSGTTLAGLSVGLKTAGDDYVALGIDDTCFARSLFRVVKQDRSGLARIPHLQQQTAHMDVNWRGKVMFDPDEFYAEPFVGELALGAVVLPRIAHLAEPVLQRIKPREVMLALMTSNLHQFPAEHDRGMSFYAELLRRLPSFRLDLSPDAEKNGRLLKTFIAAGFPLEGMTLSASFAD